MVAHGAFGQLSIADSNGIENGTMLGKHAPRTPSRTEASALAFDQQVMATPSIA